MSKKTLGIAVGIIVIVLAFVGVSKFNAAGENGNGETVTIAHESGETVVNKNPGNIVVFDYGILDALDVLGIDVIGIAKDNLPEYLNKFTSDEYISVGSLKEPNMEKIYELKPEIIIISGRQADYYDELSKIAPTINLAMDNSDYMGSFKKNMEIIGQIFDKEKEVAEKVAEVDKSIEALNKTVTEKGINSLITLANDGEFSVYGESSRFGIIHQDFGFTPVDTTIEDSTHGTKASFEYVVEQNPDYLFVIDRAAVAGGSTSAKDLFENELMKKTNAYNNGTIVYLDAAVWYTAVGGFTSTEKMVNEVTAALK